MIIKAHPVSLGNHNNVHYIAIDKSKNIRFKLVVFPDYSTAFITSATCKIDTEIIDQIKLVQELAKAMTVWNITLYDSHIDWNVKKTTDEIIEEHINYFM